MASNQIIDIIIKLKDEFSSQIKNLNTGLEGTKKMADSIAGSVFNMKNVIVGAISAIGMRTTIKDFTEFDDLMRQTGAISGAVGKQFEDLTQVALRMGQETRYTASNAADGLVKMSMAGFSAQEQMDALPGIMQLAAAGNMDIATSTDIAASALRSYGIEATKLQSVNDVFVKTFTSTNSTLVELGEGFKYVAPVAKNLGVELTDLMSAMGRLHDNGIKGSMAGTSLRGALAALMSPTKEETVLMNELSARIGGVGLRVKDTQGNFVGFVEIIKQLEQAGLRGDEALELFGLRAGPAMAALVGAGSKSLVDLKEKLDNAGGTAADIATKMEAGIGGAFRTFMSRFESFRIAIGKGFDEAVSGGLKYFVDEFDKGISGVYAMLDSGDFQVWANKLKDAFLTGYDGIKLLFSGLVEMKGVLSPVVSFMIELSPLWVTAATGAKLYSVALGFIGVALTAIQAHPIIAGLTAFAIAVKKASDQIIEFKEKADMREQAANIEPLLEKLSKFKDFKMPDDFANSGVAGIQKLNKELDMSKLYWETALRQAELAAASVDKYSEEWIKAQDVIREAKDRLAELASEQEKVNNAVSDEEKALRQAEQAHSSHVDVIKKTRELRIKDLESLLQKELKSEEINFLAKQGIYKDDPKAWETYQNQKYTITQKYHGQESKLRVEAASQLQSEMQTALDLNEQRYNQDLSVLQESVNAGLKTRLEGLNEAESLEKKFQENKISIVNTMGSAVADAERANATAAFNNRYAAFQEGLSKEQTLLNENLARTESLYQQDKQSKEMAEAAKSGFAEEFYQKNIALVNQLAEESLKANNLEAYKELLAIKGRLTKESGDAEVAYYKSVKEQKEALANAELGLAQAQYNQQIADIERYEQAGVYSAFEAAQAKKQAEIDFLNFKLEQINAATQAVIAAGETETAAYKSAVAQRMQAQTEIDAATTQMETARTTHNSELRAQYDEAAKASQQATESIKELGAETEKTSTRVVSMKDKVSEYFGTYAEMGREAFQTTKSIIEDTFSTLSGMSTSTKQLSEQQMAYVSQTRAVETAWKDLGTAASDVGLHIRDLETGAGGGLKKLGEDSIFYGKSLSEAAAIQQNMIDIWVSFNNELKTGTADIQGLITEFSNLGTSSDTITSAFQVTGQSIKDLSGQILDVQKTLEQGNISGAEEMSAAVIDAYQKIYDDASETLDGLKDQWQTYGDKVLEINAQIADINKTTEETIRDLRRDLMTEEQVWQDQRLEYEEKFAEASKLLATGNIEEAVAMYKEAQGIAKDLASELTDVNGNVIASLEQNTALSIDMIKKADAAMTEVLTKSREDLITQQATVKSSIDSTLTDLTTLSTNINNMQSKFGIEFTGKGSEELPLSQKIAWAGGVLNGLSQEIISAKPAYSIDFSAATDGIKSTGLALSALTETAKQTSENVGKSVGFAIEKLASLSAKQKSTNSGVLSALGIKGLKGFNSGGIVPGIGNKDSVPALLTPGELVIPKDLTRFFIENALHFAEGGVVPDNSAKTLWEKLVMVAAAGNEPDARYYLGQLSKATEINNSAKQAIESLISAGKSGNAGKFSSLKLTAEMFLKFNSGGIVPGIGNKDTVPAMLTPGELVIPKDLTKFFIENALHFAEGGVVPEWVTPKWKSTMPQWEKMDYTPAQGTAFNWQSSMKDMGKLNLAIADKEIGEVYGKQPVLDQLNAELRHKRLTG